MRKIHVRQTVKFALRLLLPLALAGALAAQGNWAPPDEGAIRRIEKEGFQRSQVMEVLSYLTDVYGPRLTNSPNIRQAAHYAVETLRSWGLSNVHEESWGPFGRGWSNELFEANEISPRQFPLIAYPMAWTEGTNGPVTAEVVYAKIEKDKDFKDYEGKLEGKFVMTQPPPPVAAHFEAQAHRFTDEELAKLAQPRPARRPSRGARRRRRERLRLNRRIASFLTEQEAAAWLEPSALDDGTIRVTAGGPRDPAESPVLPRIVVAVENYGRIFRTLEKNIPVTLRINVVNKWYDDNLNSFNLIAEIPGTDEADQVVMLGAHFDSWDSGTGATDNAAGSAAMMEAMLILKASGLRMRRTVRLALWTGEEEGLLGSRAYVKQHFADRRDMQRKPEYAKLSAYFNLDDGTGKIRGIYLQGNEAVRPIFEKWIKPFRGMGMTTLSPRSTGSTDHVSFDEVGLPGFAFIQDPIEYETRTHHTNMDVYERIQEADMKQMAVIAASFAYLTANADQEFPRKPLRAR